MTKLFSYVVRYDSGFAPNPFYGYCTLATCKPGIRQHADIGDWIVGCGSSDHKVRRGGTLVYAMQVTEVMTFDAYDLDERFGKKKPFRNGSRKQSCGDNIYFRNLSHDEWQQRDSFHSLSNGQLNPQHVKRDTSVDRVLISDSFVYFGGSGPKIPSSLQDQDGRMICKFGIGYSRFDDPKAVESFQRWVKGLGSFGYQGAPFEWVSLRG